MLDKLQTESVEAIAKFESISEKWAELKELKDPMSINDELELQKERIKGLMKQKDIIIVECRDELKLADARYTKDLHKQGGWMETTKKCCFYSTKPEKIRENLTLSFSQF